MSQRNQKVTYKDYTGKEYKRQMLKDVPLINLYWDKKRNELNNINLNEISRGSSRKVFFKCPDCGKKSSPKGESPKNKLSNAQGALSCSCQKGKRIVTDKNRLSSLYPDLVKDWSSKNSFIPDTVTFGSNKIAIWECHVCHHEWETKINRRTGSRGRGCKPCSDKKRVISLVNDANRLSLNASNELLKQWNNEKNEEIGLLIDQVSVNSSRKAYWNCDKCSQTTLARIANRARQLSKCSICYGIGKNYQVTNLNSLRAMRPDVAEEWNHELNNQYFGSEINPDTVPWQANKPKYWLNCKVCKKPYQRTLNARINQNQECNKKDCKDKKNLLSRAKKYLKDDLLTNHKSWKYISKLWDYKKNDLLYFWQRKPHEFRYGSEEKVYWKCLSNKSHSSYQQSIKAKTIQNQGCPKCKYRGVSRIEFRIYSELKFIFDFVRSSVKIGRWKLDIYLESWNFGIEFDGRYFHENRYEHDLRKNKIFWENNNIRIMRIREVGLPLVDKELDFTLDFGKSSHKPISKVQLNTILNKLKPFWAPYPHLKEKAEKYLELNDFQNKDYYHELIEGSSL